MRATDANPLLVSQSNRHIYPALAGCQQPIHAVLIAHHRWNFRCQYRHSASGAGDRKNRTLEKNRTQLAQHFGIGFIIGPIIQAFLCCSPATITVCRLSFLACFFAGIDFDGVRFGLKTLPDEEQGEGDQRPSFSFGSLLRAMRLNPTVGSCWF